jgi:hypothetical protein
VRFLLGTRLRKHVWEAIAVVNVDQSIEIPQRSVVRPIFSPPKNSGMRLSSTNAITADSSSRTDTMIDGFGRLSRTSTYSLAERSRNGTSVIPVM